MGQVAKQRILHLDDERTFSFSFKDRDEIFLNLRELQNVIKNIRLFLSCRRISVTIVLNVIK